MNVYVNVLVNVNDIIYALFVGGIEGIWAGLGGDRLTPIGLTVADGSYSGTVQNNSC